LWIASQLDFNVEASSGGKETSIFSFRPIVDSSKALNSMAEDYCIFGFAASTLLAARFFQQQKN
jgi:hypothetical protein